jgi:UDP:flavonoid glycosyltransferase YjiC (YdhE family)
MRLLFASTAGAGHVNPLVPWMQLARARGHDVLVVGPPELGEAIGGRFPFRAGPAPDPTTSPDLSRIPTMTNDQVAPFMIGEVFARYNSGALLPTMQQVVEQWRPDLVLRDPTEFASAVAATAASVPAVRVGHGLARGEESMLGHASAVLEEMCPGTTAAVTESPYLTMWPEELDPSSFAGTTRYRHEVPDGTGEPTGSRSASDEPLVYVTFGTVGPRMPQMLPVYRHAVAAAGRLDARVLVTVGRDLDVAAVGSVPDNVRVEPWADQREVLRRAAAVLSHGGSGTTLGALEAGCPQVVYPLFADQASNARVVETGGLGVALLDTSPGGAPALRVPRDGDDEAMSAALQRVLATPEYAAAAGRIAASLQRLPTPERILPQLSPEL